MQSRAYVFGRADYTEGKCMSDNRFKAATAAYLEWQDGWIDAVKADPLLDEDEKLNLIGDDQAK